MLLYNGLSDKLLPVSYEEFSALETLLEHLDVFEKMYPDLFNAFKKAGFTEISTNCHLSDYKTKKQSITTEITISRLILLWTVI